MLISSSLAAFQQFGIVTTYAIRFAPLWSVIVLPSLLVPWDRWNEPRGENRRRASTSSGIASPSEYVYAPNHSGF